METYDYLIMKAFKNVDIEELKQNEIAATMLLVKLFASIDVFYKATGKDTSKAFQKIQEIMS